MKVNQKAVTPLTTSSALEAFGGYLKKIRIQSRLTHEEVSTRCSFSRQTLARIERGDPSVAVGQILRYAETIGVEEPFNIVGLPEELEVRVRVRRTREERAKTPP